MTAEDLKYTFQLVTDPKDPGAAASRLSTLKRDGMKVMDERTLRLTFDGPFSPLPDVLGETGSSALRVVGRGYDVRNPVGTGPFKFKSFTPGERSVFVRNENYWRDGSPHLDEVVLINFTDDAARVNALLSGQVDAIAGVPNSQVRVLEANEKVSVINSVTGSWNPITMRVDAAPLDDKRVRQALRLLADREELVAQVLGGHGTVGNDLFGKFDPAFNAELPQREVDVEQARSLLKQAGRENLSLDFYTSPVSVGLVAAAEAFVQQASKAGVDLRLRQVDSSTYFDRFFMKVPLAVSYWGTRNYLLQAADSMMPNAPYNETHWSHEGWTKLVTAAFAETDDAKRKQLIGDAQAIEHEEGGYINWGFYNRIDAVSSKVGGVVANRSGFSLNAYRLRDAWLNA
jgi:peptide/nickel transport system substrate-binding protein